MRGIFITATDTGVGKTLVTGMLAKALLASGKKPEGIDVWKPVQSGAQLGDPDADSTVLHQLAGLSGDSSERVGATYVDAVAPWAAAKRIGEKLPYDDLLFKTQQRLQNKFCLVEGAGGLLVPLTLSKTVADLIKAVELPILIVARPGLGTVNHTLLTIEAARARGIEILGVILNGVTEQMDDRMLDENVEMIERFAKIDVIGIVPWLEEEESGALHPVFEQIIGRILK